MSTQNLSTQPARLTAIILAGGRGRRMGMQNKGFILLKQKPLIEHVIDRMRAQVDKIVISANDELARYRSLGFPVISDAIDAYAGPLAGIYSVMQTTPSDWYLTAPCDVPYIPADYAARLCAASERDSACVAHDGQRQQSGCCLLHHSLLPKLTDYLRAGESAVHGFLSRVEAKPVDFSDAAEAFVNVNTPEDLSVLNSQSQ